MAEGPKPRLAGSTPPRVGGEGQPDVFCADEQAAVPIDVARWQQLALAVLRAEGVRGLCELAVIFINEHDMAELNEEHMGAQGATDVLAFPIDAEEAELVLHGQPPSRGPGRAPPDGADMPLLLGDVVICPQVAQRQAPDHAGTLDDELALLVVHGVLHVLGHDHHEAEQRRAMRARELALLEAHHWGGAAPTGFRQHHDDDEATAQVDGAASAGEATASGPQEAP